MSLPNHVPMVTVTRGPIVESIHYGSIVVSDNQGNVISSAGDPEAVVFLRSSSKPFQVLPLVEMGGMEQFGLTERELAVMCASHSGTDDHVDVVMGIQKKLGISADDLLCGMHTPGDVRTAERMFENNEANSPLRHNCSGKHTGMLAQAILQGYSKIDYINPTHPVQKRIIQTFSEITGVPVGQVALGTDGCSAPVFAVPLRAGAFAFARLADPSLLPEPRRSALIRIFKAMTANPDMVAGPDTFDTALINAGQGKILTKGGAEGYQAIALLPGTCDKDSVAYGITLKISDGDLSQQDRAVPIARVAHDAGGRARSTAAVEALRQLEALTPVQLIDLKAYLSRPVYNWRHVEVGEVQAVFILK